jgi:hypothetical protein
LQRLVEGALAFGQVGVGDDGTDVGIDASHGNPP